MTDESNADDQTDDQTDDFTPTEIEVTVADGGAVEDAGTGDEAQGLSTHDLTVPETLRELADRLENDEDTQLICGIVGIDERADGKGTSGYELHATTDALDALEFNEALHVTRAFNQRVAELGFDVGVADAQSGGAPQPTLGDLLGSMAGGPGSGPSPDDE